MIKTDWTRGSPSNVKLTLAKKTVNTCFFGVRSEKLGFSIWKTKFLERNLKCTSNTMFFDRDAKFFKNMWQKTNEAVVKDVTWPVPWNLQNAVKYYRSINRNCFKDFYTDSISPRLSAGGQRSVPNFEKGGIRKKMSVWRHLKISFHRYLPGRLTVFLVKRLCKIRHGFKGSNLIVNLGLFQPNNRSMSSFVTF